MTLIAVPLSAAPWAEVGDAGDLIPSAQTPIGVGLLDAITGNLVGSNDIDLFKILVTDTATFSITVSSSLSLDNDSQLFVFNSAGLLVADDDDFLGLIPQINPGDLAGPAGIYYVAFDLFNTDPLLTPGLTGWIGGPSPDQTGPYTLEFTSAAFVSDVPEASTYAAGAFLAAAVGGLWLRRRKVN